MKPSDIHLIMTCSACPEQYDALNDSEETIGCLRLRGGRFMVECPDVGGKLVLAAWPMGDGIFESGEREMYLDLAREAIAQYWNEPEESK